MTTEHKHSLLNNLVSVVSLLPGIQLWHLGWDLLYVGFQRRNSFNCWMGQRLLALRGQTTAGGLRSAWPRAKSWNPRGKKVRVFSLFSRVATLQIPWHIWIYFVFLRGHQVGLWRIPCPMCPSTGRMGTLSTALPGALSPCCPCSHVPILQHRCHVLSQDIWIPSVSYKQTSSFFGTFCSQFISEPDCQRHPQAFPLKLALQRVEKPPSRVPPITHPDVHYQRMCSALQLN